MMSTITELRSSNVKRLTAVQLIPPPTGNVVIGGKNGQGKSSLLDSLLYALAGKGSLPEKPVRNGTSEAEIEVRIDTTPPLIVRRKIKPNGSSSLELKQVDAKGIETKVSKPQTVLDSLVGKVAFDPLAFTRLGPQDQVATLKEIVGVDTSDLDASIESLMEQRKKAKQELSAFEAATGTMTFHEDIPEDAIEQDTKALSEQLQKAQQHNQEIDRLFDVADTAQEAVTSQKAKVADLEKQLAAAKATLADLEQKMEAANKACTDAEQIDTDPIIARIQSAGEYNQQVRDNANYRRRQKAAREQETEILNLTDQIEQLREDRVKLMGQAKWPVEGLAFGENGVTFKTLPFSQCSSAEQLRISTAVGLSQNPQLKLMLIRDGSLLDDDNLALLDQMAREHNAQVWIERVSTGSECSVIIEEGHVSKASKKPTGRTQSPLTDAESIGRELTDAGIHDDRVSPHG